ncbi:hypothetical protein T01_8982, partial [Trichinella spiralis]
MGTINSNKIYSGIEQIKSRDITNEIITGSERFEKVKREESVSRSTASNSMNRP